MTRFNSLFKQNYCARKQQIASFSRKLSSNLADLKGVHRIQFRQTICRIASHFLFSLANLFACINSAANFLIYMLRGKKFRKAFCDTYSWCSSGGNNSQMPTARTTYTLRKLEGTMTTHRTQITKNSTAN